MDDGKTQITTLTGVAVAMVALSRFVGSVNPELVPFLRSALTSGETAGLAAVGLELLRMSVSALG